MFRKACLDNIKDDLHELKEDFKELFVDIYDYILIKFAPKWIIYNIFKYKLHKVKYLNTSMERSIKYYNDIFNKAINEGYLLEKHKEKLLNIVKIKPVKLKESIK